jgi:hypothetical protein
MAVLEGKEKMVAGTNINIITSAWGINNTYAGLSTGSVYIFYFLN